MDIEEVKDFLVEIDLDEIVFDAHFYKRVRERPINEGMVRDFFSRIDKLEFIEEGNKEDRFKLWFRMSRRYFLIVIIEVISKSLKVLSAWNTDRRWKK